MAFHFHHRKLLNDSVPAPPLLDCQYFCTESNGTCPPSCSAQCPNFCKFSLLPSPPLPLPPPLPPYPLPPPSASAPPDLDKPRQLSKLLIASLAVLATAFFLFTCYTVYKFYTVWRSSSRRRRQQSQRRNPEEEDGDDFLDEAMVDHPIWYIRTVGLQQSEINAITIIKYKRADGLVEGTDCAVCLSEFEEDEALRLLPKCNHAFHISCIDTWLGSHTNCPMCRAGIVSNAGGPLPSQEPAARDSEEGRPESVSVEIEDDGAAGSQSRLETNEDVERGDCKVDLGGLQPVRRSVSMDSVSASSMISAAAVSDKNSEAQLVMGKESRVEDGAKRVGINGSLIRLVGSPGIERYVQMGSSSIKRSASCSAKVVISRHSSSRMDTGINHQ